MHNLTSGVFEHLDINSPMDVYQRVAYIQRILRRAVIKRYKAVLLECYKLARGMAGEKWNLSELKGLSMDNFCTWLNSDGVGYEKNAYLVLDKCVEFKRDLWL